MDSAEFMAFHQLPDIGSALPAGADRRHDGQSGIGQYRNYAAEIRYIENLCGGTKLFARIYGPMLRNIVAKSDKVNFIFFGKHFQVTKDAHMSCLGRAG